MRQNDSRDGGRSFRLTRRLLKHHADGSITALQHPSWRKERQMHTCTAAVCQRTQTAPLIRLTVHCAAHCRADSRVSVTRPSETSDIRREAISSFKGSWGASHPGSVQSQTEEAAQLVNIQTDSQPPRSAGRLGRQWWWWWGER